MTVTFDLLTQLVAAIYCMCTKFSVASSSCF